VSEPAHEAIGTAIATAARTVRAPDELRVRLAAPAAASRGGGRRRLRHPAIRIAGALALACVVAVAVVLTTGGSPSLQQVASAALHPPQGPARAGVRVGAIRFPDLRENFGWAWAGQRVDEVDGRRSVTVIYRRDGRGVHYAIVDGGPISLPDGARRIERDGRSYAVLRDGDVRIVAWEQDGHTCVLASRAVGVEQLLRFASWNA
jgi:hypothetical protein